MRAAAPARNPEPDRRAWLRDEACGTHSRASRGSNLCDRALRAVAQRANPCRDARDLPFKRKREPTGSSLRPSLAWSTHPGFQTGRRSCIRAVMAGPSWRFNVICQRMVYIELQRKLAWRLRNPVLARSFPQACCLGYVKLHDRGECPPWLRAGLITPSTGYSIVSQWPWSAGDHCCADQ